MRSLDDGNTRIARARTWRGGHTPTPSWRNDPLRTPHHAVPSSLSSLASLQFLPAMALDARSVKTFFSSFLVLSPIESTFSPYVRACVLSFFMQTPLQCPVPRAFQLNFAHLNAPLLPLSIQQATAPSSAALSPPATQQASPTKTRAPSTTPSERAPCIWRAWQGMLLLLSDALKFLHWQAAAAAEEFLHHRWQHH